MLDLLFDFFDPTDIDVDDADIDDSIGGTSLTANEFDGVDNGTFEGDDEELEEIAEAGMLEGTDHIDSSDIVRDIAARDDFLESIGYDSVPEGYQVHHIIPLSEGGSDDPSNMILLSEEDHAAVTAAHRQFYEWSKD